MTTSTDSQSWLAIDHRVFHQKPTQNHYKDSDFPMEARYQASFLKSRQKMTNVIKK
jgi:hypothetical protein